MDFLEKALSYLSSLSSDPLFSIVVTLYTLVLLYFPRYFLGIVFSPVMISTGILLFTLLRLGAIQERVEEEFNSTEPELTHHDSTDEDRKWVSLETNLQSETESGISSDSDSNPFHADRFVEWNVRGAPLEVIHEENEGEEEDQNDDVKTEKQEVCSSSIERYPSLSMYYPETDSDTSSGGDFPVTGGWDSPESLGFRWDEEEREGLIEIDMDGKLFHVEEDNLIEIDISPAIIR